MAYNISQLRYDKTRTYIVDLQYEQSLKENAVRLNDSTEISFRDVCLTTTDPQGKLESTYSYYLKFTVKGKIINESISQQNFVIKLRNSESEESTTQSIRNFSCGSAGDSTFELVINPNSTYDEVRFELNRIAIDFSLDNGDGTSGRIMNIEILKFCRINNLLGFQIGETTVNELKKIGIQAHPGLLFTLNGEEFRIGRRGVYELYNEEIAITYIGFVIDSPNNLDEPKYTDRNYFIMDFKY